MSAFRPVEREGHSLPELDDRELLARLHAGDAAAFEHLFRVHYEAMCSVAYAVIRSRDAAEDIVANVFRKLWQRRFHWEPRGSVRNYLLIATRNEATSLLRQLRRHTGVAERASREDVIPALAMPAAAPDAAVASREIRETVEHAMAELPVQCRSVFELRWSEGLKHREIAERMGLSIKTVEAHMTRALRLVRDRLRPHQ